MGILSLLLAVVVTFCFCSNAEAGSSMKVLLHPSGGRVQVCEEVTVSDGRITFPLPSGADTGSLSISLDKGDILGWEVSPVAGKESPAISSLREKLEQAQYRLALLQGALAGVRSRIALWEGQDSASSPDMLDALEKRMRERLPDLYAEQARTNQNIRKEEHEIETLERTLQQKGSALHSSQVTVRVRNVSDSVQVCYAYNLIRCGWKPVYRLDAHPDTNRLFFVLEAEIQQGTGQDWNDVELTLSSAPNSYELAPSPLESWRLRFISSSLQTRSDKVMAGAVVAANDMPVLSQTTPQQETHATFSSWKLGTQSILAGTPVRLVLETGDWQARYVRVARPSVSPGEVFLMAEAEFPETAVFPAGKVSYMVDGVPVGTGFFPEDGRPEEIYFGIDPRVSVDMKLDLQQSGQKGFVDKRQTRVWAWKFEVCNQHSVPVTVRIEDPEPQSADESIHIKVSSSPKPEQKDHVLIWNLTLPEKGRQVIEHTVEASAPADVKFLDGRP